MEHKYSTCLSSSVKFCVCRWQAQTAPANYLLVIGLGQSCLHLVLRHPFVYYFVSAFRMVLKPMKFQVQQVHSLEVGALIEKYFMINKEKLV